MKKLFLILGIILCLIGGLQTGRYLVDYDVLSEYGKGYVWGSIIMLVLGLIFLYFGLKKKS
jgi:hypothetical protein